MNEVSKGKVEREGAQVFLTGREHFSLLLLRFQGQELLPDARRGIMINERSLVIQRVDRAAAGAYVCQATNSAGTGASAEVALNVKCELDANVLFRVRKVIIASSVRRRYPGVRPAGAGHRRGAR